MSLEEPLLPTGSTKLGVLKDRDDETRVSLTVDTAKQLIADGYEVIVESGAGAKASQADQAYQDVGCTIGGRESVLAADVLFRINAPESFEGMAGKVCVSFVGSRLPDGKAIVQNANASNVTLCDVTMVPRITIAQKLDVLSSQGKVAGHRAVVEATNLFGRFHASEMTAAGKYPPSQTFILGVGVAGLAAIGTSRALGSVVRAWDVRDVAKEQVESMGARWVTVNFKEDGAGEGGYAKESSQEFQKKQQETFAKELQTVDIAITTAAIPGKKAPLLITEDMLKGMKPGSVIVDLAASTGGNCECTKPNEVTTVHGVYIVGYTDLPGRMALQASAMYGQNMVNFLRHVHAKDTGKFVDKLYEALKLEDAGEIVSRSVVCCYSGKLHSAPPPPPVGPAKPKVAPSAKKLVPKEPNPFKDAVIGTIVVTLVFILILAMGSSGKIQVLRSFLLAGAAGYQAVWGVAHALHTPLMAVTNAISGLTVVGGIHVFNEMYAKDGEDAQLAKILGAMAACVSTVNIVGGFIVTQRMLNLFKRKGKKEDDDYTPIFLLLIILLLAWAFLHPKYINLINALCAVLCVAAIACLATMKTANLGCKFGIVGVVTAVGTTVLVIANQQGDNNSEILTDLAICLGIGGVLGGVVGLSVGPMKLPQTVAGFHSLVGLAAMTTSVAAYYQNPQAGASVENISAIIGNFIGGVTLTGSLIAFAKLDGRMASKEWNLPCKNWLNLSMLFGFIALSVSLCRSNNQGYNIMWGIALLSCVMGIHLVASVGGGDMPVCVTVLNSYSGWALAAEGFNMEKPLLACVGAIIGFSGAILTKIMCDAMNRDIFNVLFGGLNTAPPTKKDGNEAKKTHVETTKSEVADILRNAKKVAVVPGYGMAVGRAQGPVGNLAAVLRKNGVECTFVIHPVAGRMPGQMNVLLAEADVPHDWVKEMDEVNDSLDQYDVCFCIGSNDIVNSAAQEVEGCSIWGMPVIEVWKSKQVIFMKRTMGGGYADLDNPVFFKENTKMFLGNAKETVENLVQEYLSVMESAA